MIPIALVTLPEYPDAVYWQYADGHRTPAGKLEAALWQELQAVIAERNALRAKLAKQARVDNSGGV